MLPCFSVAAASNHHGHSGGRGGPPPAFSNGDFSGIYADSFHGTAAGSGLLTSDGNGNVTSGNEAVSDGTNFCFGTLTGTYTATPIAPAR